MRFRRRTRWPRVHQPELTAHVTAGRRVLDPAQQEALRRLCRPHAQGVYLWGPVGRGKTMMADAFYRLVPAPKRRLHIHQFLAELNSAVIVQRRPFAQAIRGFRGEARFLYLDELHLHDVADAHLIRRTVASALESGTALLVTSNYPPGGLLPNPLYHHHAVPLIESINATFAVIRIGDGTDYRQLIRGREGFAGGTWCRSPGGDEPAAGDLVTLGTARGQARTLQAHSAAYGALAVSFRHLCEEPLSAADYSILAARFTAMRLTGVPHPERIGEEPMQRFAFLIDVLVNADVQLHVSAATGLGAWHAAGNLPRDADRLLSRLSLLRDTGPAMEPRSPGP